MPASLQQRLEAAWAVRGPLAGLLWPLSLLFGAVLRVRRAMASLGMTRVERLPVPVIVVGNLVAGGAGKTPAVRAVVALLRERGWTPGIVSRGYGRHGDGVQAVSSASPAGEVGDEPLLLHLRTGAPVQVGRDRPGAGRALLQARPEVDIVVTDDGLQHRRLARDAQLIVFDERGIGNGWLLPAGPLREPFERQPPTRSVVIYNAPVPSTGWPGAVAERSLAGALSLDAWWRGEPPSAATLDALGDRPLLAVAGIARPERFFAMLRARGLTVRGRALPDHDPFLALPWPADTPDVILTEKDAVKLPLSTPLGSTRVWVATLDFRLDAASASALLQLLPAPPRRRPKE